MLSEYLFILPDPNKMFHSFNKVSLYISSFSQSMWITGTRVFFLYILKTLSHLPAEKMQQALSFFLL